MGTLIRAIIEGLFGGLFAWLDRRKAEADRTAKERDEAVLSSQAEVKQTEHDITQAGDTARNTAGTDLNGLR